MFGGVRVPSFTVQYGTLHIPNIVLDMYSNTKKICNRFFNRFVAVYGLKIQKITIFEYLQYGTCTIQFGA